ncbi:uncharacterized protein Z520_07815 [Fonsecaea multimorphosa CBS 102226]|uniref:Cytochrome P450 monooxygenase n=1 Tax=Fonsecaea multimorphosa CBS 102226 TaxID=1442371 RepID=A0A0D2K0Q3_9EURO|nr:uncharacterized protein Z520_07815 [Fonsecaea multimorphosa CBS 102226]KIX96549.1 hypothetical protein Z520_07815 [Fonsecaea multimorphosa CBS 102226]OAL22162.1 hypothetical protein AYO22_07423 [Fonsecaea multimorphosa]
MQLQLGRPFESRTATVGLAFASLFVAWRLALVITRIWFSPLRHIPGPRLAAATSLWLYVEDNKPTIVKTTRRLHSQYGPLVRIAPNHVSIKDADTYLKTIYQQASHFNKDPAFYDTFANEDVNVFTVSDAVEHGYHRRLLSGGFARKKVLEFEPEIWKVVTRLMTLVDDEYASGRPVDLTKLCRSFALDVVSCYSFGESYGALWRPTLDEPLLAAFDRFGRASFLLMNFPTIRSLLQPILIRLPSPVFQAIPSMAARVMSSLDRLENIEKGNFQPMLTSVKEAGLRQNTQLSKKYLAANGMGSIVAGTDTTGFTLALGIWSIFMNDKIRQRLHSDLKEVWHDRHNPPGLRNLEAMPYLQACVRESLRFATPIRGRLPRLVPPEGMTLKFPSTGDKEYFLPGGTSVSSSVYLMHYDESVYDDPETFDPERWLVKDPDLLHRRERQLVPFSSGSRICIGLNIATAELYVCIATIIRWYKAKEIVDRELVTEEQFTALVPGGLRAILARIDD